MPQNSPTPELRRINPNLRRIRPVQNNTPRIDEPQVEEVNDPQSDNSLLSRFRRFADNTIGSENVDKVKEFGSRLLTGDIPGKIQIGQGRYVDDTPENQAKYNNKEPFSILPKITAEPETFLGGFAKSIYNDFVSPFGTAEGIISSSGPRRFNLRKIQQTGQSQPINILQAPRNPRVRAITNPNRMLGPAPQQPRFISGQAGLADNTQQYKIDLGPVNRLPEEPVTVLPRELGEINPLDAATAARTGTSLSSPIRATTRRNPITGRDEPIEPRVRQVASGNDIVDDAFNVSEELKPFMPEQPTVKLYGDTGGVSPSRRINRNYVRETSKDEVDNQLNQIRPRIRQVANSTNTSANVIEEAIKSTSPEVREVVNNFIKTNYLGANSANNPLAMLGTRLKSIGNSGVELYRKSARFGQQERFNIRDWADPFKQTIGKLRRSERNNFGDYVEGALPIPNSRVRIAVEAWKKSEELAGKAAESSGMVIKAGDTKIPFKRIASGYWPRRLTPEELKKLPTSLDKMIAAGMTRAEAMKVISDARKYGELILPQQHSRLGKLFNYRKDANSGLHHLESMSKVVARTREFGRYDVAGKGTDGIADLIESTSNPALAQKLMDRVIGNDTANISKTLDTMVRVSRTVVSWARLQNYGISSIIGNQLPNMLNSNTKQYVKSLGAFLGRNKGVTDHTAAAIDISHGVFEQTRKLNPMGVYGGKLAENIVRGQAAGIGQGMARTFFREAKKNPNNLDAKKQLFELILEDPDKLLTQAELTPAQLRMAGARNAEISQGLTNTVNLPEYATAPINTVGDATIQLMLIFKKQAALQSKMMKDAFKRNPVKTAALVLGFSQLGGEAIGRTKSTVMGTARGVIGGRDVRESIKEEIEGRSDYLGRYGIENKEVRKAIDRALQSWAFGIFSDVIFSAFDEQRLKDFVVGPVIGGVADIGTAAVQDTVDLLDNDSNTTPVRLGREGLKALPIPGGIGTTIQKEVLPTRSQERRNMFRP